MLTHKIEDYKLLTGDTDLSDFHTEVDFINEHLTSWQLRDTVYNLCVEKQWFTRGDNRQYDTMFLMLEEGKYAGAFFLITVCSAVKADDGREFDTYAGEAEETVVAEVIKALYERAKGNVGE